MLCGLNNHMQLCTKIIKPTKHSISKICFVGLIIFVQSCICFAYFLGNLTTANSSIFLHIKQYGGDNSEKVYCTMDSKNSSLKKFYKMEVEKNRKIISFSKQKQAKMTLFTSSPINYGEQR